MARLLVFFFACAWLSFAGAANAHKLVKANEVIKVAKSDVTVSPSIDWNRISQRPGESAERWTLDGELLNDVLFFGGVQDGRPLLREVDKRDNPLPKFSADMLLIDLPSLVGSTFRVAKGHQTFEVNEVRPVKFLGEDGVRFEFSTVGSDDIRRRGRAVATIRSGRLYMMTFEAPEVYFFGLHEEKFEQLISSARLQ